jgi:A118 family predicted phage portal protein
MSFKCGFGPNYFSYSRQQGLRTATEVSSDNSQLFRNVRKHEQQVGKALKRLFAGAYASECALCGVAPTSVDVDITWDDSIVEDTATERAQMKDDIARNLAPAWLYPMRFYGMSEDEARALVDATPKLPEEA